MKGYGKKYWAKRSQQYNRTNWVENESLITAYLSMIRSYEDFEEVLEVGIGTGVVASEMIKKVNRIKGVDISSEMVSSITNSNIEAIIGDAHDLPFEDRTLDLIYMRNVIHYLDDPQKAVYEINRCLKKGAYFLFSQVIPFSDDISKEYDWLIGRNIHYPTSREILNYFTPFSIVNKKEYVLKSQSIMNWLNNTCKNGTTKKDIIKRHHGTSEKYKSLVNYSTPHGDIFVDIKHYMVLAQKK